MELIDNTIEQYTIDPTFDDIPWTTILLNDNSLSDLVLNASISQSDDHGFITVKIESYNNLSVYCGILHDGVFLSSIRFSIPILKLEYTLVETLRYDVDICINDEVSIDRNNVTINSKIVGSPTRLISALKYIGDTNMLKMLEERSLIRIIGLNDE